MTQTSVMENGVKALEEVHLLHKKGYKMENIYVLAHKSSVTHKIADLGDANEISLSEQGVLGTLANIVRNKGDELRAKLQSIGISEAEAKILELEMDKGHILVISTPKLH